MPGCQKCGNLLISERIIEDGKTKQVFCPICASSYTHLSDKQVWETPQERMERLKRTHTCKECGKEFSDYMQFALSERVKCDKCLEYAMHIRDITRERKPVENGRSPWRVYVQKKILGKEDEKYHGESTEETSSKRQAEEEEDVLVKEALIKVE